MAEPDVSQRYHDVPRELAVWWTPRREATKIEVVWRMFTHEFGHELRLEVSQQFVESRVCRADMPDVIRHVTQVEETARANCR